MKKRPAQTYQNIDIEYLRNKLKLKALQEKLKLVGKYPETAKLISTGVLAGALLLGSGILSSLPADGSLSPKAGINITVETPSQILLNSLKSILPAKTQPLALDQEKKLEIVFKDIIGIPAKATLEGEHLNTSYGLIGAEQLLRRYPGDTADDHNIDTNEGMAPGLGAWGYFAPSKSQMTPDLVEKEKWYAVVQTLYLPDWQSRLAYLRDWYKYRKVLIVNTLNGNAVVADIADSGPAAWTGKSFGGSPAVMQALGGVRYKVGPVVLFFVDDANNKIPLGPVNYNNQ